MSRWRLVRGKTDIKEENAHRHRNKNHRIYEQEHWKVVVNASTGYEVTLNLDKNMEFLSMTERHLSWVHATIFHGKEVIRCHFIAISDFVLQMTPSKNILIPENDIRFHVQTAEPIATNSNLFKYSIDLIKSISFHRVSQGLFSLLGPQMHAPCNWRG